MEHVSHISNPERFRKAYSILVGETRLPHIHGRPFRLSLTVGESARITRVARERIGDEAFPIDPLSQVRLAQELAQMIELHVPRLAETLTRLRYEDDFEAVVIHGLPLEEELAPAVALALSCQFGVPFNYAEQNSGALAMRIAPRTGSAANTNTTRGEFEWHSDDAAMPESLRATWITLYGVFNPPRTLTGYVPIRAVLDHIAPNFCNALWEPRYSVRVPISFGLGENMWTDARPILAVDENDMVTVACPTFATKSSDPHDVEAKQAFDHFCSLLDRHATFVPVSRGTMLAFNNARGLHMRTAIGNGERLIFRTYVRPDLNALRSKCGHKGHIFSLSQLL